MERKQGKGKVQKAKGKNGVLLPRYSDKSVSVGCS